MTRQIDNPSRRPKTGINHLVELMTVYTRRYAALPFDDIVRAYHSFEKELLDEARIDVGTFLLDQKFTLGSREKASYRKKSDVVVVSLEFLGSGRMLIISIQSLLKKHVDKAESATINAFGLVRSIEIRYHNSLAADVPVLLELLKDRFLVAYEALETAFVRSSADFTNKAYRGLYATLETALALSGRREFFPKCRFAIADEDIGFYYLDPTTIRTVVELFKSDQSDFLSPLELSIWLITSPFPFQKSVSIESVKRGFIPITLPFRSNRYIHEAGQVVRATIELFGNEDYTVRALCKARGFFLVIAIPADHKEVVLPLVSKITKSLQEQFENGISNCSPIIGTLKKASKKISVVNASDFVSSIIAKIGVEFVRG